MNGSVGKKNDETGMMTVEAVLCLVPFILVILGIISFINIFIVHSKIQAALYETANELSAYTYFYQALSVREADSKLSQDILTGTTELTAFMEDIETARANLEGGTISSEDFTGVIGSGRELVGSPQTLIRNIVYLGIDKVEAGGKKALIAAISGALTENYLDTSFLADGGRSADSYLKAFGVRNGMKGMDFGQSTIFMDSELKMIDIVVEYDLDIYFFRLFFKDPSIHVVQRAVVPAWLDGDGGTY